MPAPIWGKAKTKDTAYCKIFQKLATLLSSPQNNCNVPDTKRLQVHYNVGVSKQKFVVTCRLKTNHQNMWRVQY